MAVFSSLRKRLSTSVDDLERERLQQRTADLDVTPLDQIGLRTPVRVGGEVKRTMVAPRSGVPNFEVTIDDGTGLITAVFAGRRHIPGIEHGRTIVLEGVAVERRGQRVVYNPLYTLLP